MTSSAIEHGIVVLADDLTGACDSGAPFLMSGRRVRVLLDLAAPTSPPSCDDVIVFSSETRNAAPDVAAARIDQAVRSLLYTSAPPLFFKKVDSTVRGNVGAETMAALDASGTAIALVAPAFPAAGRTVDASLLTMRDAATRQTTVPLRDYFPAVDDHLLEYLTVADELALRAGIAHAISRGTRVLLCDAVTQTDLERLARAACLLPQPLLWTGSAGLAQALATVLPRVGPQRPIPTHRHGRTLLFVGTDHPVTTLQLNHLESQSSAADHSLHRVAWIGTSAREILSAFAATPVAALVITGGDTAAFVLRTLGASAILLAGELSPGIPWGIVEGGLADGCMVVTKSGGFGSRETLVDALDFCSRRICEPA